jgi:hypothetical protein
MDLLNQLNWNLIKRENYQVLITKRGEGRRNYIYNALSDLNVVARSPIFMIGVSSTRMVGDPGEPVPITWKVGGWASAQLPILPGSTTEFTAFVEGDNRERVALLLGKLNLVRLPYLGIYPFILNIAFPHWIEQIYIEVWQYGESPDGSYQPPNVELHKVLEAVENQSFDVEILDGNPPPRE